MITTHLRLLVLVAVCVVASTADAAPPAKHHFVLVHGGWQGGWEWYKVATSLEALGHEVTTLDLPSHGIDGTNPSTVTLAAYTAALVQTLDAAPTPVIVVAHSMGGIVASSAAEARPTKVRKLVYLCAFLIQNGQSLLDVALTDTEALITQSFIPDFANATLDVDRAALRDIYYNTSPPQDVTLASTLFKKNALQPLATPLALTAAGWGSVRRFYIETTRDHAISPSVQRRMYSESPVERVYTLETDHSPFFSAPFQLTAYLLDIARR